ncbi:MAG TPA: hypothetical protein PLC24_07880 [Myxococcota bacterium]|nr:hypothetical protein [Myxococcota bacterium]HPV04468.1 hypothetical protein [Myxococcota bacterium]
MKLRAFAFMISVAMMAAGCDDGLVGSWNGSGGEGSISMGVAHSGAAASSGVRVKSFVIKLFRNRDRFLADKPFFESGCSGYSQGFNIGNLPEGSDYVVMYLGYADRECSPGQLVSKGVRGGMRVTKQGTGDAFYYIPVNSIGLFNRLALPDRRLNPEPGDPVVTCLTDADCRRVIPCEDPDKPEVCPCPVTVECEDWEIDQGDCPDGTKVMQYNVHPGALCLDGTCRLESLFPLNTRGDRAFAASVSTSGGDVVTVGGFSFLDAGRMKVAGYTDEVLAPETFFMDGGTGLFEILEHDRALDVGLGLASAAMIDATRLVVVGGTSTAGTGAIEGVVASPVIESQECVDSCPVEYSPYMYLIDTTTGAVSRATMETPIIASAVVGVSRSMPGFLVRAGAQITDMGGDLVSGPSRISMVCNVSDTNGISCNELAPGKGVARFMPTGVCLEMSLGLCTRYLTIGGTSDQNRFAEIYYSSNDSVKVLTGSGQVPAMLSGATAFVAGDRVWTVGGTSDSSGTNPAVPYSLQVDEAAGTVIVSEVAMGSGDVAALSRSLHRTTVLADDRSVLVTGGVDRNGSIVQDAVLLRVDEAGLKVVESGLKMDKPRIGHSATLVTGGLLDGSVLITGGFSSVGGDFAAGAELYLPR